MYKFWRKTMNFHWFWAFQMMPLSECFNGNFMKFEKDCQMSLTFWLLEHIPSSKWTIFGCAIVQYFFSFFIEHPVFDFSIPTPWPLQTKLHHAGHSNTNVCAQNTAFADMHICQTNDSSSLVISGWLIQPIASQSSSRTFYPM